MTQLYFLIPAVHGLAAVFWVGGIFLTYMVVRPAAVTVLEPPHRLNMMAEVFRRFFPIVWGLIAVLLVSGYIGLFFRFGGMKTAPVYLHTMQAVGLLMVVLFAWLFWGPYARFRKLVADKDYPAAGAVMNTGMKPIILVNLILGTLEVLLGTAGPFLG